MEPPPPSRADCLRLLFPRAQADLLRTLSWRAIRRGLLIKGAEGPFALWSVEDRERLGAFCRLVEILAPTATPSGNYLVVVNDVAARFRPIIANFHERCVWICCLDSVNRVDREIVGMVGGDTTAPPPLKSLLRHMLIREQVRFLIADFRPFDHPHLDSATLLAFDRLREVAGMAGVRVTDWVVLGYDAAASAAERLRDGDATENTLAEAA